MQSKTASRSHRTRTGAENCSRSSPRPITNRIPSCKSEIELLIAQSQTVKPVLQAQHVIVERARKAVVVDFSDLTSQPDVLQLPGDETGNAVRRIEAEAKHKPVNAMKEIHAFQCLRPSMKQQERETSW